jgi:hypothetical protein
VCSSDLRRRGGASFISGGNVVFPELIVKINVSQFNRATGV